MLLTHTGKVAKLCTMNSGLLGAIGISPGLQARGCGWQEGVVQDIARATQQLPSLITEVFHQQIKWPATYSLGAAASMIETVSVHAQG